MTLQKVARSSSRTVALFCGLMLVASSATTLARQSVSAPKNLRVTGVTDWTVSLGWDAPKTKAPASYVVQCTTNGRR